MSDDRLSTELYVQAHVRQCFAQGLVATILHKGDAWGGAILLKIEMLGSGCRLLSQTRDEQGAIAWLRVKDGAVFNEPDASAYIERQIKRDPDLWVVEIEDRAGRNPFPGRLL